jgi:glycosyltransferase involved in cell wall biosynthesis
MKVALLTLDFPPGFIGGVSAWSMDMATALSAAGHELTVFAKATGNPEDTAKHDAALPFSVRRVWGRSWSKYAGWWMAMATYGRLGKLDLVLAATWPLATQISGAHPLAIAFHGSEITTLKTAPSALKAVISKSKICLPVSQFLAQDLDRLGCATAPVTVLPMPLNLDTVQAKTRGDALVCVARPTERKGIDRAIAIAKSTGRTLHLVGPDQGPEGTIAHGVLPRHQALEIIGQSAAIVLTPRTTPDGLGGEGLGLCLLEAAAMGVPALGCATGGVPEAVGVGLVLSDPDNPNGAAINRWLADGQRGEQARIWVAEHHGAARAVAALDAALNS